MNKLIYHIVPESEFKDGIVGNNYIPARFEEDGFVHCTEGRDLSLLVAKDYYGTFLETDTSARLSAGVFDPLLILQIDTIKLTHELKFEAPAPIAGGGDEHLVKAVLFPHIYGAVNLDAVVGNGRLLPDGDGFAWPTAFEDIHDLFHD